MSITPRSTAVASPFLVVSPSVIGFSIVLSYAKDSETLAIGFVLFISGLLLLIVGLFILFAGRKQ